MTIQILTSQLCLLRRHKNMDGKYPFLAGLQVRKQSQFYGCSKPKKLEYKPSFEGSSRPIIFTSTAAAITVATVPVLRTTNKSIQKLSLCHNIINSCFTPKTFVKLLIRPMLRYTTKHTVLPRSIAPRLIANLAYRQNSRLSRFPLSKIPCYTAKLSYRHPPQVFRHKSRKTNLNPPISTANNYLLTAVH